jgi:glutaminase
MTSSHTNFAKSRGYLYNAVKKAIVAYLPSYLLMNCVSVGVSTVCLASDGKKTELKQDQERPNKNKRFKLLY